MKRRWAELAALSALPAFTLILATSYQYWAASREETYFQGFITIITGAAALLSILAIALSIYIVFDRSRVIAEDEKESLIEHANTLQRRLGSQTREIELLAAMREVGHIVSREVSFEKILASVLEVVAGLFSPDSMTIFITETNPESTAAVKAVPKVHRSGSKTWFGDDVPEDVSRAGVDKARTERVPVRTKGPAGVVECALPLVADEDVLGVLSIVIPSQTGEADEFDEVEKDLVKLVRHIALAIKTPTLYDRAVVDALTRLYTKRHFSEVLTKLFHQSTRLKKPLSMVMIDIDHFKKFNDNFGHLTGDLVLAGVSEAIRHSVRRYDTVYRYGGEEIAILLPDSKVAAAQRVARRVRETVEGTTFHTDTKVEVSVTVSCGVASWRAEMKDFSALIAAADGALYKAKEKGRNCVVTAPEKDCRPDVPVQAP